MNKTWMPIAAGIIEIVSGMFQMLVFALFLVGILFEQPDRMVLWPGEFGYYLITSVTALMGLLAMVGGTYTLERKRFCLSLAGAFAACFASIVLLYLYANDILAGIGADWPLISIFVALPGGIAVILVLWSRKKYE